VATRNPEEFPHLFIRRFWRNPRQKISSPGPVTKNMAVPLAKTFDSFDATLRLAAMTDQTEDFRDYITQTQKMRALSGKVARIC